MELVEFLKGTEFKAVCGFVLIIWGFVRLEERAKY